MERRVETAAEEMIDLDRERMPDFYFCCIAWTMHGLVYPEPGDVPQIPGAPAALPT